MALEYAKLESSGVQLSDPVKERMAEIAQKKVDSDAAIKQQSLEETRRHNQEAERISNKKTNTSK